MTEINVFKKGLCSPTSCLGWSMVRFCSYWTWHAWQIKTSFIMFLQYKYHTLRYAYWHFAPGICCQNKNAKTLMYFHFYSVTKKHPCVALTGGNVSEMMPYFGLCIWFDSKLWTVDRASNWNVSRHGSSSASCHESKQLFGTTTPGGSDSRALTSHTRTHPPTQPLGSTWRNTAYILTPSFIKYRY